MSSMTNYILTNIGLDMLDPINRSITLVDSVRYHEGYINAGRRQVTTIYEVHDILKRKFPRNWHIIYPYIYWTDTLPTI